jgi:lysozyme family protein
MDGGTSASDTNEGFLGDALRRLAFGKPAVHCRLVPVQTRGATAPSQPLETDTHYASLTLAAQSLSSRRVLTTRYRPVFYAQAAFSQDLDRPIRLAALVADPKDVAGDGPSRLTHDGVVSGDRALFGQTPWRGRLDAQFSLLACRSEALLKALIPLGDDLRKSLGDGGADAATPIGAALKAMTPGALAMDLATATARAFIRMDGDWTPRFEFSGPLPELASGHYAILALRNASEATPALEYDPDARLLYAGGAKVHSRDYAVIRVDASTRRENIADIPDLGAAFEAIDLVYASGGDIAPTLEKFRRLAMTTPHLTGADRRALIDRVVRRTELLKAAVENPEERNESILSSLTQARGLPDLNSLWKAAPRVLEGLRAINAAVTGASTRSAPSAPAGPVAGDNAPAAEPGAPAPASAEPAPSPPTIDPHSRFSQALAFTLRWEGGFSDDPADRGGRTMRGVTERIFHAWLADQGKPTRPVNEIRDDELNAIYRTNYWLGARCAEISPPVDFCQFDAAVNHGPGGASRLFQRALNTAFREMKVQTQVKEDGAVGPVTLREARRVDADVLVRAYLAERRALYQRIVEKKPDQSRFLKGWINRVADLERFIRDRGNESIAAAEGATPPEDTAFAGFVE